MIPYLLKFHVNQLRTKLNIKLGFYYRSKSCFSFEAKKTSFGHFYACHMPVLSCAAHGCFVILGHVLMSLSGPSPLLSDYCLSSPTCSPLISFPLLVPSCLQSVSVRCLMFPVPCKSLVSSASVFGFVFSSYVFPPRGFCFVFVFPFVNKPSYLCT